MLFLLRRPGSLQSLGRHVRHYSQLSKLRYIPLKVVTNTPRLQPSRFASTVITSTQQRKATPKFAQSERILQDQELQKRYIENLRKARSFSTDDLVAINDLFTQALEAASGEYSDEAYRFVVRVWIAVFKDMTGDASLQHILLKSRSQVANLCINNLDYKKFLECSAHLPGKPEWAEIVARTLQFQALTEERLQFNIHGISTYLRGSSGINEKRLMLATFLRKALLYSRLSLDFSSIFTAFIRFANDVGDGDLLLTSPKHLVYQKALSLLGRPKGNASVLSHIQMIEGLFMKSEFASKITLSNLLSTLMTCVVNVRPAIALEYWNYKEEHLALSRIGTSEFLTLHDLLMAMWGLFLRREFKKCLELYSKYPKLHHDDQIDVMLKISEETKDWRQLQSLFEDMYGRGDLPFVQHYAIVMNALASIKVVKEVDELFEQLLQRNLVPTCDVYAAVIRSRIAINDYDGAKEWFDRFLRDYENGSVAKGSVARVHALIFGLHLHKSSLTELMQAVQEVMEKQKTCAVPLVDTKLFCDIIKAVGANYGIKELDELWELAGRFSMKSEEVYEATINALTRMGEYEKADDLTFEGHMESFVPFTSSLIAKAQLKNLRSWYNATTDRAFKPYLASKTMLILRRLDQGKFSLRNRSSLLVEAIKFELSLNRRKTARSYLDQAKALEDLLEQHFLPFLRYHCQAKSHQGASAVLELYREMAAKNVVLTSSTYVYLLRALIEVDRTNSANYLNSYKLLESVFELYGLSMFEHIKPMRASSENMQYHAENLLKIVASYVTANSKDVSSNMDLVVHFLNQMKDRLGSNIPLRFRLAIFKEMGSLYHLTGDDQTARKLAFSALDHLFDVVDHYRKSMKQRLDVEPQIPKLLQLDLRQVVELLVPILRSLDSTPEDYERLANSILQRNIHLAGPLFRTLIERMMRGDPNESRIRIILDICERYLVAGNWVEANIEKKQQYVYKLFILHLTKRIPLLRILENYSLFNQYYNVKSIEDLRDEFKDLKYPAVKLQQALDEYGNLTSFKWSIASLLKDPHKFFLPGRSISTRNIMDHRMTAKLYTYIGRYCEHDRVRAFKLYDEFPDTMEYLLYYGQARTRIQIFHNEIDDIQPRLASSANEGRKNRRYRTLRALRLTMRLR